MALLLVISIVCVIVPLVYRVNTLVNHEFTLESRNEIAAKAETVIATIEGYKDTVGSTLWQVSRRADLAQVLKNKDMTGLERIAKDLDEHSGIDFITVTDATGTVLLRGHSQKKGDSIAGVACIKGSLQGSPLTIGVEAGNEISYSVRGGAPIYDQENKLIGIISAGVRLDTQDLVSRLSKSLQAEVTFFKQDTRVSSTLKDPQGQSMVGTKATLPELLENTLRNGKVFASDHVTLSGRDFAVYYQPLLDSGGKVSGMLFLGVPRTIIDTISEHILHSTLLLGGVVSLLMVIIGIFVARMLITKPLSRISKHIGDLVDDRAELSHRIDTSSGDEVASLAHQVNRLTGKVDTMLCSVESYKNVMHAIPEPVFAVDDNYKVTLANLKVCNMAGVAEPELLYGKHINDVLHANIFGTDMCPMREVMRTHSRSVSDIFPLIIDGKERKIRGLSDVIKDCNGVEVGFFQICSDITDMVEQERKIALQLDHTTEVNNKVREIAKRVTASATSIQEQTGNIQDSAMHQSKVMQQTLKALEQMNQTVVEISRSASAASEQAGASQSMAAEGRNVVNEAMRAIDSVRALAVTLNESLKSLGAQAEGIGQIMNVISDIADQTNLLALNAAIEAARAGEAGRGFAVVADEVRKLAEKTMGATQEVRKAITDIQHGANSNIDNMQDVANAVEKATELSTKSGTALNEIVNLVSESSSQIASIAAASEEQSVSSELITKDVNEVTEIAENTVQQTAKSAQASDDLAMLANELDSTVR
jgi:PAS domain S-box-containing protein